MQGHSLINRGEKANRGQCWQPGRQLCFSSSFQKWFPNASAGFPLRAQRINMFYLDSCFQNPLGTRQVLLMRKSKYCPWPTLYMTKEQNIQKPAPSKQQQLQPGKRAETRSKALARRIPSILQPPALSSSLRTAATLGMPAATLDQRTALLLGQVSRFCSCSKESNRQWGVC